MNKYGVIFDMDGVLADTLQIHGRAEEETLASINIFVKADEILERFNGIHDSIWFKILADENDIAIDVNSLLRKKWKNIYVNIEREGMAMLSGSLKLLTSVFDAGYSIELASGSPPHFIDYIVDTLEIRKYFISINSTEDVEHGKPESDLFLFTAKNMERLPESCLVIEDALSGMTAAKNAGMKCIGLVDDTDSDYPADLLVNSLTSVTLGTIQNILES